MRRAVLPWVIILIIPGRADAQDGTAKNAALDTPVVRTVEAAKALRAGGSVPAIDGKLDDEAWLAAPALTDFRQTNPIEGALPSEATEVRFLYTDRDLY